MKKSTIICCVVVILGIAYFDDIKNMFTGDENKARVIMQEYMQQRQNPSGNSDGDLMIHQSSPGHYDGPSGNVPIPTTDYDKPSTTTPSHSSSSSHQSRPKTCNGCMGTGRCRRCGGDGITTGFTRDAQVQCAYCYGKGICASCHGSGQQ